MKKVNSGAKLTHEDVEQIRQLNEWKKEEIKRIMSIAGDHALAEKFGVAQSCISKVVNYRTW
jgi:hypothetical protein